MLRGFGILTAVTSVTLTLAGCGAGNTGHGGTSDAGQAQGVYSGTTSNGYAFESIVLPNDKYYEVYGTLDGNLYSVTGMVAGQGASGNRTYAADVADFLYTGQTLLNETLTASVLPGSSLGGTLTQFGALSGTSFTGTSLPASSFNYNAPASLADIAGSWTGTLLDGTSTTVTFSSSGAVNGYASGCSFTGTTVADASNKNFFDVSLKFGGTPCAFLNESASGIAVDSLLPDGVTHKLFMSVTEATLAGTAFLAQRSNNGGGATLAALDGQYAFSLAGFDVTGNPMSFAGSIKADGQGHISGGEMDVNDNGAISSNNSLSGTYAFDSNIPPAGTYAFNSNVQGTLGTIALTYTVGGVSHPLAFGFSLQADGSFGQIMSLDINDFVASGTLQQQSPSAFTLASLAGDYIVALSERNASNPTSVLGRLTLASGGISSNVVFDRSIAGMGTAGPTTGVSATVAFSAAGPDANGRGTFTLTLKDALASTTQDFAYYAVTAKKIIAVESDANGTMTADFSGQSTPFTAATVVTAGSVFAMSGQDMAAAGNEIAAVGQLQITGVGANAGTLHWDSNDAGMIVGPASFASQAVPVFDPTSGRGTVTIAGGELSGVADSVVFYLTAPGTGFLMDTTAGVLNRVMTGTLTAQAGGPYSAFADLAGLGIMRTRGTSANNALSLVGLFGLTTSPGTYAMLFDQRVSNGAAVQTQMDQSVPGITVQAIDEISGRGTLSLPSGSKTATEAFYVVGPTHFVFIDISPVSSGLNGPSSLFFVDTH
jgi:hypothetical protein